MLNMCVFQGRISNEPLLEVTGRGHRMCKLRVAVERDHSSGGERKTDFLSCIAWSETAAFAAKYFHRGDMVIVRGRLEEDIWKDKEGNSRSRVIVNVDSLYFGETKRAREEREQRRAGNVELTPLPEDEFAPLESDDIQLPF